METLSDSGSITRAVMLRFAVHRQDTNGKIPGRGVAVLAAEVQYRIESRVRLSNSNSQL